MSAIVLGTHQKLISLNTIRYDVCGVMTDRLFLLQVAAMGLPGRPLHLPALPALLPPLKRDHPRCRVLLPGGHHPGLHLPRPRGGSHRDQHQQPAQFPDRQPEAAAGVAAAAAAAAAASALRGGGLLG